METDARTDAQLRNMASGHVIVQWCDVPDGADELDPIVRELLHLRKLARTALAFHRSMGALADDGPAGPGTVLGTALEDWARMVGVDVALFGGEPRA